LRLRIHGVNNELAPQGKVDLYKNATMREARETPFVYVRQTTTLKGVAHTQPETFTPRHNYNDNENDKAVYY